MLRWNRAVLALVVAWGSLSAQDSPSAKDAVDPRSSRAADALLHGRSIEWQRTLADAEALAKATDRPLLIALNMDGESASDRIWHENYRDPEFVALTRRCVCVCASVFRHNANDYDTQGRRIPCPRIHGLTCGEHMALEPKLFARYFLDGERVAPRHALVLANGDVAMDLSLCFDLTDVDRALAAATADLQPVDFATLPNAGLGTWANAASRRDASGRTAFEHAIAACRDPRDLTAALAAIEQHGDAGSLPALHLMLARISEVPLDDVQRIGNRLGLANELQAIARVRAQRTGPVLGNLQRPADFDALLAFAAQPDADVLSRAWLCALAATTSTTDISWQVMPKVWPAAQHLPGSTLPAAVNQPAPSFAEMPEPVSLTSLLDLSARKFATTAGMPGPVPDRSILASRDELHQRLSDLDSQLANDRDNLDLLAAVGVASLDLARVEIQNGGNSALFLLEDAANFLQRVLERDPTRYDLWLERARAAYYRQRFDEQRQFGITALKLTGYAWPPESWARAEILQNGRAVEAMRFIGDADARLLSAAQWDQPLVAVTHMRSALLAFGLAAISPYGTSGDQVTWASFAASFGLLREETAILMAALKRLPAAGDLRAALAGSLWRNDRWASMSAIADQTLHPDATADTSWWAGYANLQVAEELRRREQPDAAGHHYAMAEQRFAQSAEQNPDYQQSVAGYLAASWLGRGLALAQGPAADRRASADCLVRAVSTGSQLGGMRDGLGYDALDLVDKILEWRAAGPSPVNAIEFLDRLNAAAPESAFWAAAVSDSALREGLRADGRNQERVMADTVDAAGEPMRAMIGLPTELGDRYLHAAIVAGESAVRSATATEEDRQVLAQALTVHAERQLLREQSEGVRDLLTRAAAVLAMTVPQPADDDGLDALDALRAIAAPLRERLGPARPRLREGR